MGKKKEEKIILMNERQYNEKAFKRKCRAKNYVNWIFNNACQSLYKAFSNMRGKFLSNYNKHFLLCFIIMIKVKITIHHLVQVHNVIESNIHRLYQWNKFYVTFDCDKW